MISAILHCKILRRNLFPLHSYPHYASLPHHHFHHYPPQTPFSLPNQQQHCLRLLLKACSKTPSSKATKSLHALIITTGSRTSVFIINNLLTAYAVACELSTARQLFDEMPERNVVSYNSMIAAYNRQGNVAEAWKLFLEMMDLGLKPTQFTVSSILSSSLPLSFKPCLGLQLQPLILKIGLFHVDAFSGTALLGLFVRGGKLDDAFKVFEEMPQRSLVTWNALITGFSQNGFFEESMALFRELLRTELRPSEFSFLGILSVSHTVANFEAGEQIHGLVIKTGTYYFPVLGNALIDVYARCFNMCIAERMFNEVPVRDVVSWNTMIAAFAKSERPEKAMELFLLMSLDGLLPTCSTFASVVTSCTNLKNLACGKFLHAKTIKNNLIFDVFVGSAFIDFYKKCDDVEAAYSLFNEMPVRSVVSWNALISGCSSKESSTKVLILKEMLHLGFRPDESSFSAVLYSCPVLALWQLHSLIIRMGYEDNDYVSSSAIVSYANNGLISDALTFAETLTPLYTIPANIVAGIYNKTGQYRETKDLLYQLKEPDIVSWNTLIEACARNGDYKEAFELFEFMQTAQILPDKCTFVSLLNICSRLCNLALGSTVHGLIIKTDVQCCDILVYNLLVDMYAKCGSLESSIDVFDEIADKNLISWTVLISGLGLHGDAHEALKRFRQMELEGIRPDRITLIAVLSACRHGGLVEEGIQLFQQMNGCYGVKPDMDHYLCIVDMLCRNGYVKEAERVIGSMPFQPNALIWRTFLGGCQSSSKVGKYKAEIKE